MPLISENVSHTHDRARCLAWENKGGMRDQDHELEELSGASSQGLEQSPHQTLICYKVIYLQLALYTGLHL